MVSKSFLQIVVLLLQRSEGGELHSLVLEVFEDVVQIFQNLEGFGLREEGVGEGAGGRKEEGSEKSGVGEGGESLPTFFKGKSGGFDQTRFYICFYGFPNREGGARENRIHFKWIWFGLLLRWGSSIQIQTHINWLGEGILGYVTFSKIISWVRCWDVSVEIQLVFVCKA